MIFGESVNIDLSNPSRPKVNGVDIDHLLATEVYQDRDGIPYIDFDAEFAKLKQTNQSLASQPSSADYSAGDFADPNNRVIDVSTLTPDANGHIVINLAPDVLTTGTPITIAGLSPDADGNTVIINVDTGGQADYEVTSQVKIQYSDGTDRDNKETEHFGDNHLLWNFIDRSAADQQYQGNLLINRPFQGSILAPSATVHANQNIDGNIIADKVIVNAETHRWDLQDNSKPDEEEDNDLQIAVPLPGIDIELPNIGKPDPEEPGSETPEEEDPEEELEYGHEHPDYEIDDFGDDLFDADSPAAKEELLTEVDQAIARAKAAHNSALVAQLEALRQRLLTQLGYGNGTGLPQTSERSTWWTSLVGLSLLSSLLGHHLLRRKRS